MSEQEATAVFVRWLGPLLLSSAGGAGVAWAIFRHYGQSWLDSRFARSLEDHKHAQQRELESLKFKITSLLDRTVKIHEREFDIIPEVWMALVDAQQAVAFYTSSMRQYPAFMLLKDEEVGIALDRSPLLDFQKRAVINSTDRQETYTKYIGLHEKSQCGEALSKCQMLLRRNGIFFQGQMRTRFDKALGMMWSAYDEQTQNVDLKLAPRERKAYQHFVTTCANLMQELECEVRDRLWSSRFLDQGKSA